ncbi:hypothetical protein [Streptomyces lydicus]|uniref:hypothetical protein n=1 Tax=Streptomyces lydicus TaxID=47763 RepID=UPI00131AAB75|nr:hypothetical protein [Streptomyces lydicus]
MRQPIESALSVVQGIIEQQGSSQHVPTVEELIEVVRSFERVGFDVPAGADSDGFLFQYGKVNWFSDPTFTVGFARQFELVDPEGDHGGYSQVQLEYRYRVDADFRALENYNSWWFRESGNRFDEWLDSVKSDPIWRIVREKTPVKFDVSQDLA